MLPQKNSAAEHEIQLRLDHKKQTTNLEDQVCQAVALQHPQRSTGNHIM